MALLDNQEKRFPQFANGIGRALLRAILTDSEVFLLAVTGVLLGARSRRIRALGAALGGLVLARRADQYVGVFDSNMRSLVRVIHESNQPSSDANG